MTFAKKELEHSKVNARIVPPHQWTIVIDSNVSLQYLFSWDAFLISFSVCQRVLASDLHTVPGNTLTCTVLLFLNRNDIRGNCLSAHYESKEDFEWKESTQECAPCIQQVSTFVDILAAVSL